MTSKQIIDYKTGEVESPTDAYSRHQRIIGLRNIAEQSFLSLGRELYHFEKDKQYQEMGHQTFNSYLADPDVDIERTTAFRLKGIYETFVLGLKVPPVGLLEVGNSKLDKIRPYMNEENVDEWIKKAATLSRSDLSLEIQQVFKNADTSEPVTNLSSYKVSPSQVWKLGRHRVICGDAYSLIDTIQADALITDSPYGIEYKPEWNKWNGNPSDYHPIIGDDKEFDPAPFMNFPTVAFFGANYFSNRLPLGGWICWDKRTREELDAMFGSPFELAWYRSVNTTRKSIMIRLLHGGVINADSVNGNNDKRYHATQKPVALMETVIKELTLENDVIVDPFAGSGSTLLACERSGRTCVSIEIDPNITAIILQRWADATGDKPCKE